MNQANLGDDLVTIDDELQKKTARLEWTRFRRALTHVAVSKEKQELYAMEKKAKDECDRLGDENGFRITNEDRLIVVRISAQHLHCLSQFNDSQEKTTHA